MNEIDPLAWAYALVLGIPMAGGYVPGTNPLDVMAGR